MTTRTLVVKCGSFVDMTCDLLAQTAQGAQAPWWGVPVVAGVFLLLGGVLGFWSNWLLDGRKQKRSEYLRWDEDIRKYTSELVALSQILSKERIRSDKFINGARSGVIIKLVENFKGDIPDRVSEFETADECIDRLSKEFLSQSNEYQEVAAKIDQAKDDLLIFLAQIELIAPHNIAESGENLVEAVVNGPLRGKNYGHESQLYKDLNSAISELMTDVRNHLQPHRIKDRPS